MRKTKGNVRVRVRHFFDGRSDVAERRPFDTRAVKIKTEKHQRKCVDGNVRPLGKKQKKMEKKLHSKERIDNNG